MPGTYIEHFKYTIPAGEIQPVWAYNRMLTILENTAGEDIDVSIGGQPFTTFKKGIAYELPEEHEHLLIKNTAVISTTIEFTLSLGRVYDNRVIFTDDIAVVNVSNDITTYPHIIALDPLYLIDNAAAVDKGGGKVGIPVTGSPFTDTESVIIVNTVNYNGTYTVQPESSQNEVVIIHTYYAETFDGVNDKIGLETPRYIPADLTQKELIIQNNGSAELWVGDSNVNSVSKDGTKILTDSAPILSTTAAVYLMSKDAGKGGVCVSFNRLRKV